MRLGKVGVGGGSFAIEGEENPACFDHAASILFWSFLYNCEDVHSILIQSLPSGPKRIKPQIIC